MRGPCTWSGCGPCRRRGCRLRCRYDSRVRRHARDDQVAQQAMVACPSAGTAKRQGQPRFAVQCRCISVRKRKPGVLCLYSVLNCLQIGRAEVGQTRFSALQGKAEDIGCNCHCGPARRAECNLCCACAYSTQAVRADLRGFCRNGSRGSRGEYVRIQCSRCSGPVVARCDCRDGLLEQCNSR